MTCLPAKASRAQLDTKTHQIVIQSAYLRNDQDKPMSPAEIERELHDSNGIEKNTLALQPWILVTRNALEYVTQGPIMIAFRDETDATHYKTSSGVNIATPGITSKRKGLSDALTAMNSHTRHAAAAASQGVYTAPALTILQQTTRAHVQRVREGRKVPAQ